MPKLAISCSDWLHAATYGDLAQLEKWLSTGALDVRYDPVRIGASVPQGRARIFDVSDADKRNALFVALSSGQVDYALRLMEIGKFPATRTRDGRTAMHMAAMLPTRTQEIISALVGQGHGTDGVDNKGSTPLLLAIQNRRPSTVAHLLAAGANPNGAAGSEHPPLFLAARRGMVDIVESLLALGADPNVRDGSFGGTPLHTLAANWDFEDNDEENETPTVKVMKALLKAGADPDAVLMDNGKQLTVDQCFYNRQGPHRFRQIVAEIQAQRLEAQTQRPAGSGRTPRL